MSPRELRAEWPIHSVDNNIRLFRLQLISIFIPFSLRIVPYIAVGTLTSLEGVCTYPDCASDSSSKTCFLSVVILTNSIPW
ncbi:hypothetical protein SeLEV6574_g00107 [Synchytrium endobioticum]|uniref:Uncharacterized protein n=1 Tax=Synchytrium endobioticum TaxID=286115 RepID=A0A507DJG2_9FUNG|nr:hypothetical protein SeLEV6574_g00107 [Synchytrium endobioticum]